ncbi:peroxiredoxin [Methylobacterium oryzihabitans]|uniref:peroxiredoxin n=1 Tax=Methylobacterium oryzihabitans TaxID=2499852 RepID=UPI001FE729CA|nr:peroxiredoxin [Methylobacterium oryzihabitans]
MIQPDTVPDVTFHTRVRNDALGGPNPFEWKDLTSAEVFGGRNIVLFAVPGAFTPACSDDHLPGYEQHAGDFAALGIDGVVCLSVNDAFVMYQWARSKGIEQVFMLPDGNGDFTRQMGMLVKRGRQGMGMRSWRYSMHVEDGRIRRMFVEPGFRDDPPGVGLQLSDAGTMLAYLRDRPAA